MPVGFEGGYDVALEAVADHEGFLCSEVVTLGEALVGLCVFVGDDMDVVEEGREVGAVDLTLLVEEFALGEEEELVTAVSELLEGGADIIGEGDGHLHEVVAEVEDLLDGRAIDGAVCGGDGVLDEGEGEGFDAIAGEGYAAGLGRIE